MFRVWTAEWEVHLALVAAHGTAWTMANVGFTTATVLSAAGLALLGGVAGHRRRAECRARRRRGRVRDRGNAVVCRPRRPEPGHPGPCPDGGAGTPTEPAETLLGSATGGLFEAFMVATEGALIAIGVTLALGGGVAAPVAWLATLVSVLALAGSVKSGATIPAVIYLPTLLVGIALLAGWT